MMLSLVTTRSDQANRANHFRPVAITLSTDALKTIRRILARHLQVYINRTSGTGLLLPFREDELRTIWESLPEEGGNILLIRPVVVLLQQYAMYLTKETERGLQTLLPDASSLLVCRHIRELLYATISPTSITFRL